MTSAPIEDALRWVATSKQFRPVDLLKHAINDLDSDAATLLEPLIGPTSSLPEAAAETRALAVWGLIIDTVNKVGPSGDSRRRNTLIAAFRLPRQQEVVEPWKATLGDRFSQLLALTAVFGDPPPTTTTPMHKAWRTAHGQARPDSPSSSHDACGGWCPLAAIC